MLNVIAINCCPIDAILTNIHQTLEQWGWYPLIWQGFCDTKSYKAC